jgi:hypothetical protein
MKKLLFVLVLTAGFVWCWQNPALVRTYAAKASHEAGMFLLNLFEDEKLPDPALAISSGPPGPSQPPENIYYTRERITFGTYPDNKTLSAATQVRKVGEGNGRFMVESEHGRLVVDPAKLTRDPQEIAHLTSLAATPKPVDQNAVRSLQSEIETIDRKIAETKSELKSKEAAENAAKATGTSAPLGTNSLFLKNSITRLDAQKALLRKQLDALTINGSTPPVPANPSAAAPR